MQKKALSSELSATTYPGRGIVIGRSKDGTKAVTAYCIMGRSENSRNRVFAEDGEGNSNEIIRHKSILPSESQRLTEAAIIRLDDLSLQVIEKKYEVNGEKTNYFFFYYR